MLGAIFNLNRPAHVVQWHFFQMSVANLVVIASMLVVLALAMVLPFPRRSRRRGASWIDVFGIASICALVTTVASGSIVALEGPAWWHYSSVGHFLNSIHLWAVELFFFATVVHLWGKYWMAAWRGGRVHVWMTGAVSFLVAVPAALTGYVSQQNFDAQWISTQAKDGLNSVGVGAFFNVTDFGQMYSYHVLLLPLAVVGLVSAHVVLVRRHGVVPPFPPGARATATAAPMAVLPDERGSQAMR